MKVELSLISSTGGKMSSEICYVRDSNGPELALFLSAFIFKNIVRVGDAVTITEIS